MEFHTFFQGMTDRQLEDLYHDVKEKRKAGLVSPLLTPFMRNICESFDKAPAFSSCEGMAKDGMMDEIARRLFRGEG